MTLREIFETKEGKLFLKAFLICFLGMFIAMIGILLLSLKITDVGKIVVYTGMVISFIGIIIGFPLAIYINAKQISNKIKSKQEKSKYFRKN